MIFLADFYYFSCLSSVETSGIVRKNVRTSDTVWVIWTPVSPKNIGRIMIRGIKNIPFLAEDMILAFTPLPIDWSIMLDMTIGEERHMTEAWHLSAKLPTLITSVSFLNQPTISGAKT